MPSRLPRAVVVQALALLAAFAAAPKARAEVRLPHILSDHAVLQRNRPIHIWGWATPGEPIQVSFRDTQRNTVTDQLGKWSVYLQPEQPGGPFTLTVKGDSNTITRTDILVGDVWFASGQSNMEIPLKGFPHSAVIKNAQQEIADATHPEIHLLRFNHASPRYEQPDQNAEWTLCTPATATDFSAVAYFFGRGIQQDQHVPIGLIDSTWGGTPVSSWLSMDALSRDASLLPELAAWAPMVENQQNVPALSAEEKREDAQAKAAGKPKPSHPWHPDADSYAPAALFNGMVAPALPYTIKGVLWYQGESDSSAARAPLYAQAFPAMITDWRSRWQQGDFPFLFVQISSFTSTPAETWGIIRAAQRRTLKLADTGMAVSLDVGKADNVHPPDKQTVAKRLELAARALAYHQQLEYSGPIFSQAVAESNGLRVYFTHAEKPTAKGGPLQTFEVAGENQQFHPATAKIEENSVLVQAAEASDVPHPKYVRYAWANSALAANLYNGAGLPASTFTSQQHLPAPCNHDCK